MDLQREAVQGRELWTLPPARIIIVRSRHFGWEGLRAILRGWPGIHVVAEVMRGEQAVPAAAEFRPNAILAAVDLPDTSAVDLARRLREASPESEIMLFSDALDTVPQAALRMVGARSYVLWRDVTPLALHHCLATVLETDLAVASPTALEELVAAPQRHRERELDALELRYDERTVLEALARDLRPREIVEQEALTRPTVDRVVARLKRKLGVRTMFALGMQAQALGFGAAE